MLKATGCLAWLTAILYWPVHRFGWVYEDANLLRVLTADPRPTRSLALWLDRLQAWAGHSVGAFHLGNVALHLLTGALVILLASRLQLGPVSSLIAGAVFWLHPIQVEAVAYIAARSELLVGLGGVLAWIGLTLTGSWSFVLILGGCLLAVSAKASGIAVGLCVLWVLTYQAHMTREALASILVILALAVLGVLTWGPSLVATSWIVGLRYAGIQACAMWRYVALVILPLGVSVDHDIPSTVGLTGLALLAFGAVLIALWRRRSACWALPIGWAVGAIAPRFVIASIYAPHLPEPLAEHQLYLAMIGVSLGVGVILGPLFQGVCAWPL